MICLVTDRRSLAGRVDAPEPLVTLVEAAAEAGVDLVQIRERGLADADLMRIVTRAVDAAKGSGTKVIVNDRTDIALATAAHGVHLRADSLPAAAARSLLGADRVIGRSLHSVAEAAQASSAGNLDYLVFGTMFATPSKGVTTRLATLDELTSACQVSRIPVLAIGGMTLERALLAARAGAAGIAAIRLFVPAPGEHLGRHVQRVMAELRRAFDTCGAVS